MSREKLSRLWFCLFAVLGLAASHAATSDPAGRRGRLLVVLDCSGSMSEKLGSSTRIDAARRAFRDLLPGLERSEFEIGLLAYGHRRPDDCEDVELVVAPVTGSARDVASAVDSLVPRGRTPLATAIRSGGEILRAAGDVPLRMLVLTDGVETCGGDPAKEARAVAAAGVDVEIHVVGLAIEPKDRAVLMELASAGHGAYYDAQDAEALAASFKQVQERVVDPPHLADEKLIFAERFDHATLDAAWKNLSANEDLMTLDDGLVLLTATRSQDKDALFPNTLELQKQLDNDFDIEVLAELHFAARKSYGAYGGGRDAIIQTFRIELFESRTRNIVLDYVMSGWRNCWHGWAGAGTTTKKEGLVWKPGPSFSLEEGTTEHVVTLRFKIEKRRHTYTASVRRLGPQVKDDQWVELGSFRMLRLKPRLRLMAGNDASGQPAAEAVVKSVEIRRP